MNLLLFIVGLAALVAGASLLVRGASALALSFGVSPLVVGLTIVAFGTSSPEVAVSVGAALEGQTDIAVGNVVGSNIFNVLFILGASALIVPLLVHVQLIRQEVPIMIGASLLLVALGFDGRLTRLDAALLFGLLVVYTVFLIVQSRRQTQEAVAELTAELPQSAAWDRHWAVQVALVVAGLVLLVLGSDWLVTAAVAFARSLGVSDLVGCLGLAGLVAPSGLPLAPSVLTFDIWVMLAVAIACLPVFFTGREIARWEGAVFLGYYAAYVAYLILAAQQHDALPAFSNVMLVFVIPLTLATLIAVLVRKRG